MKNRIVIRAIASLVVTLSMLGLFIIPALADPLPPTTGSLTIHKYAGPSGAQGTGDIMTPGSDNIPLNGVAFNVYSVDTTVNGQPPAGAGVTYSTNGSVLTVSGTSTTWPVTLVNTVITTNDGSVKLSNLPQGLYFVEEDVAASTPTSALTGASMTISSAVVPFLVAVPMTDSVTGDGTGWITDVQVYPKNQALSVTKTVDWPADTAVQAGDVIPWQIVANIPGDIATAISFAVTDQLDEALTLNTASVTVTSQPNNAVLVLGTDYQLTYDTNNLMTVAFTTAGMQKLSGQATVTVDLTTTVNSKIYDRLDTTIPNSATLSFTNSTGDPYEAGTDNPPTVFTGCIQITKTDATGNPLEGAVFQIAASVADAQAGNFLKIDATTGELLWPTDTGYATGLPFTATSTISPTDGKAYATFMGLPDELAGVYQTYYVCETTTPQGYNLLSTAPEVTFDGSELNHTFSINIVNTTGFILPSTGGMGTIIFTVAGISLIGLAVIVALTKRRRSTNSDK
ncbi:MAG: SpaH/EbpB family LPXTG-anchored major pilin [Actinomycetia bacterium]|nr:SpaH/EbpB family LPXTG-anchored major pilin [Actinomycetes bacterium]